MLWRKTKPDKEERECWEDAILQGEQGHSSTDLKESCRFLGEEATASTKALAAWGKVSYVREKHRDQCSWSRRLRAEQEWKLERKVGTQSSSISRLWWGL